MATDRINVGAFLDSEELRQLTGFSMKSKQAAALRRMGVPFLLNACGKPVVVRAAIEGRRPAKEAANEKRWEPTWAANLR